MSKKIKAVTYHNIYRPNNGGLIPRNLVGAIQEKTGDDGRLIYRPEVLNEDGSYSVLYPAWDLFYNDSVDNLYAHLGLNSWVPRGVDV